MTTFALEGRPITPEVPGNEPGVTVDTPSPGSQGTVVSADGAAFTVRTGDGIAAAVQAVSCLVRPEEGDLVHLVRTPSGGAYVLAVLARPGGGALRLAPDGDLSIEVDGGRLSMRAGGDLEVTSAQAVSVSGERIEALAREGRFRFSAVSVVAGAVDAALQRLSQTIRTAFRRVEKVDHLRAGTIDHAADGLVRLHGEHTVVTARDLVKVDGGQIHVG